MVIITNEKKISGLTTPNTDTEFLSTACTLYKNSCLKGNGIKESYKKWGDVAPS